MNLKAKTSQILHRYGNKKENYLIPLSNVWLHYSTDDINIFIEDKEIKIKTKLGYLYKFVNLTNIEQFSILTNLEKYVKIINETLNEEFNETLNY